MNDYLEKHREQMRVRPVYDESWTIRRAVSNDQKQKMIDDLADGVGYLE